MINKPGKDNHLTDFLSRLNEDEAEIEEDEGKDYLDQLVASVTIEEMSDNSATEYEDTKKLNKREERNIYVISQKRGTGRR